MSPVHVLVSDNIHEEQHYGAALAGAIDLYRFRSNVEAFERLTSAAAPIDLLIISPSQDSLFNMTGAQLVERLSNPAFSGSAFLGNMQVVVIGEQVSGSPRVHSVSSLDAAIRLIKFGEAEAAPMPAAPAYDANAAYGNAVPELGMPEVHSELAGSVISAIWDAPEPVRQQPQRAALPQQAQPSHLQAVQPQQHAQPQQPPHVQHAQHPQAVHAEPTHRRQLPRTAEIRGGGPGNEAAMLDRLPVQPAGNTSLFANTAQQPAHPQLHAVQPYELKSRGAYQGNGGARGSSMPSAAAVQSPHLARAPQQQQQSAQPQHAAHGHMQQPPQLAAQVQQLVYSQSPSTGHDPMLAFSTQAQQQLARQAPPVMMQQAPAPQQMQPMHAPQQHGSYAAQLEQQLYPQQHQQAPQYAQQVAPAPEGRRGVIGRMRDRVREGEQAPMAPNVPAGVPAGAPAFDAPQGLMQRAEASADVSFG